MWRRRRIHRAQRDSLQCRSIAFLFPRSLWPVAQFVTFERAQYFANCWGAALEDAGNAGHLNADSGYGPWPRGKELLSELMQISA